MPIQRLLTGALLCALLPAASLCAKEQRGLLPEDDGVARDLPVHVVVMQPRLRPQFRYNYLDTSLAGINAGNSLYGGGGVGYGQAMGAGLVGGLIAGAIINGAEKAAAKNAVRRPYQLIEQARCDLPLGESHQAAIANALQHAGWSKLGPIAGHVLKPGEDGDDVAAKDDPRYVFTLSTSLAADFSALITTIDTAAYVADAGRKAGRNAAWKDSLVVVSDGLWLPAKSQVDIERMLAAEQQRYAASGADELIEKVNAAGANASRKDRKRALLMASDHRENLVEARSEGWSEASTAMRRAALWSEQDCARLNRTLQSNLEQAGEMVQALLRHSLAAPGDAQGLQALPTQAAVIGSTGADPQVIGETRVSAGLPEGVVVDEAAPAQQRVIEALPGGTYVSRLSGENITLGYRHMVLEE
jgi:hypothetical protein